MLNRAALLLNEGVSAFRWKHSLPGALWCTSKTMQSSFRLPLFRSIFYQQFGLSTSTASEDDSQFLGSDVVTHREHEPFTHGYEQTEMHRLSLEKPEEFWQIHGEKVHWFRKYSKVLDRSNAPFYRWFVGGEVNACYECVDVHVRDGLGEQAAIIYDSPVTKTKRVLTFNFLLQQVSTFAGALSNLGVTTGDRVLIYMPGIPEAVIAMLAAARLGAPHSVVFGGFGRQELAVRIDHAKPKVIVAASCGIEPSGIINYKISLDEGIQLAHHRPTACIIYQRPEHLASLTEGLDKTWEEVMRTATEHPVIPVDSNHPLYLSYTSGTTGMPKGVVRDHAGQIVSGKFAFDLIYNCRKGDIMFAAADIGWVLGHSCQVYGPLLVGATSILYEGKPIKTPDAGAFWRVVEEYKATVLFFAPTGARSMRKEDPTAELMKCHDLTSLKNLLVAGERTDLSTYNWLQTNINEARERYGCTEFLHIIDNWWQSETGWPMTNIMKGLQSDRFIPPIGGSCGHLIPGWDISILDTYGKEVSHGKIGYVAVKLPLPPGALTTLWENDQRFKDVYLKRFPGYYDAGDTGCRTHDGYFFILSRTDDIINVAAHRLCTSAIEEVITTHPAVNESVVVGISDSVKGQIPLGIVVLNDPSHSKEVVKSQLIQKVRTEIGPVASFKTIVFVSRLPKTKSGKTLRRTIAEIAEGGTYVNIPPTIEDSTVLDEIKLALNEQLFLLV